MKLETLSIHAGYKPEATTKAVAVLFIKLLHLLLIIHNMALICLTSKWQAISIHALPTRPMRY